MVRERVDEGQAWNFARMDAGREAGRRREMNQSSSGIVAFERPVRPMARLMEQLIALAGSHLPQVAQVKSNGSMVRPSFIATWWTIN
jgi:hypothetical protein